MSFDMLPSLGVDSNDMIDTMNAIAIELQFEDPQLGTGVYCDVLNEDEVEQFLILYSTLTPSRPFDITPAVELHILASRDLRGHAIETYVTNNVPQELQEEFRWQRRRFVRNGYRILRQTTTRRTNRNVQRSNVIGSADPHIVELAQRSLTEVDRRSRRSLNIFITTNEIQQNSPAHDKFLRVRSAMLEQQRFRNAHNRFTPI